MRHRLAALAVALSLSTSAFASPSADATRAALEGRAGSFEAAAGALSGASDVEARFGEGMLLFARAVERWGQAQYRQGLRAPSGAGLLVPLMRLPVPENPSPEVVTYESQRAAIRAFLDDLTAARAALAKVTGEVKITLDLNAVAFDLAGDPARRSRLGEIIAAVQRIGRPAPPGAPPPTSEPWIVAFDEADARWLQGYASLMSATLEFALAYDWSESFAVYGAQFYPRATPPPPQRPAVENTARHDPFRPDLFADSVAFLHSIHWPLVEPQRMAAARERLLETIAQSRASWKLILAETDDDHEWVPSPRQKSAAVTFAPVTQSVVDGWLSTLDDFEAALNGEKLVGHRLLAQGFNLKKVFLEPRPFDLVLWATGHAAQPYLADGPTLTQESFLRWNRMLAGGFLGYAAWFN